MRKPTVVCVFGISGVGKTTLIRRVLEGDDKWRHYRAGDLIKRGLSDESVTAESLRKASGDELLANQMILVESFWREYESSKPHGVILDGHLLIDTDKDLIEVPVHVIQNLTPAALVHIEDRPETILAQRVGDTQRPRPIRSLEDLSRHQSLSAQICRRYAQSVGVPVEHLRPHDIAQMRSILDNFSVPE